MKKISFINLLLIFLTYLNSIVFGLQVLSPPYLVGHFDSASLYVNQNFQFSVTGNVVLANPLNACFPITNTNVSGMIIYIVDGICSGPVKISNILSAGVPLGILWGGTGLDAGLGGASFISGSEPGFPSFGVPAVEVSQFEFNPMVGYLNSGASNITLTVSFDQFGNVYDNIPNFVTSIIFTVGGELISIGSLYWCLYKLYGFIRYQNISKRRIGKSRFEQIKNDIEWFRGGCSIPRVCLFIITLSCVERIIFFIDPFFSYDVYPYWLANLVLTGSFALMVTSLTIILFYYEQTTRNAKLGIRKMPKALKIILAIMVTIIWIIEIISSFVRSLTYDTGLVIAISTIIYAIYFAILIALYTVFSIRFMLLLRDVYKESKDEKSKEKVKAKFISIIGSGILLFIFFWAFIFFAAIYTGIPGSVVEKWLMYICVCMIDILQIWTFIRPNLGVKDSETESKSSNNIPTFSNEEEVSGEEPVVQEKNETELPESSQSIDV
jgi:hypothetical protein